MFKIPDFPLAPGRCKQAGLDWFLHEKISIPVHLYRETLRHFCMTVRWAAHCAGATLSLPGLRTDMNTSLFDRRFLTFDTFCRDSG